LTTRSCENSFALTAVGSATAGIGGGSREDLAAAVERELQRLEWRLLVAPEEENNGVTAS
jgi:hypothetical protein